MHEDPQIEEAVNAKPPIRITPKDLARAGWIASGVDASTKVIVGHRPKAMRVPAPRHPRFVIRTTWIYKDSAWKKIEDSVDIRSLKVKNQKIEGSPILSITTFKRPDDDPLQEPDSDREAEDEKEQNMSNEARLRAEADSIHHKFCHRPKNPYCKVCQKAKMYSPQARKTGGSSSITSTKYGDHITVDHIITRDMLDHGYNDQKVALVVKDVYSQFRYVYPSGTKNSDQCHEDLLHFLGKDDDVGIIYSDNAPELGQAIKRLGVRRNTSREYVDENKSVIEREIRTILEGTRANLEQSGMPEKYWPLASQHHAFALNLAKRFDTGVVPWEARFGESFTGLVVPFGAKVLYWHNPKQNVPETSKFSSTGVEGIFLGYHVQPGFIFKREYLVAPVHNAVQAIEDGTLKVIRAKRVELIEGQFVFPLDPEQIKHDEATHVPQLDDQNINNASPEADGELDDALQLMDDYLGPGGLDDEGGEGERPPKGEADEAPQPSKPKKPPSEPTDLFDPTRYPDGTPVPAGYNWDGVRLVRNKKGSKRPPDVPSECWHMYSAQQRKEEIERWEKKVARAEAAKREELEKEAPAMPVLLGHKEPHRPKYESNMERMHNLYLDKLEQTADELYALVAKVINQNDVAKIPEAQEAMDKEWQKLLYKVCWVESQVREFEDVQKEVRQKGQKAHFGRIFEICSLKGSELPKGHPQRKYKGRSVFQGNQVRDENADHAIFAELGSSPASMEAGKIIDVFGSQPGYAKQQADARQAYTQALFEGIATWVRLPRNRWPKAWTNYRDPVCPLRLALYGHPDSGGLWEKHCTKQLRSIGWVPVLPDMWQSIFYHPELDLLLVVYVDDFKMAGPKDNLAKGWEGISKVLDMDPAEPLGRYFGCNHREQTSVKLDRGAHPFAYVFDKQKSAAAAKAGGNSEPRTEDYWEVDPEHALVVRHHLYPRKRLYVPTEDDIKQFPTLGTHRVTELDDGTTRQDDYNQVGPSRINRWWTGRTAFSLVSSSEEEVRLAIAARKGRPIGSKSETKREAKQQRFKGTDTIIKEPIPSMSKPVNIMSYDMRDFLVSCVDKYCELAGVGRNSLKFAPTPFHDNKVAEPLKPNEPQGRLQPIASRVLMKVLFAARMARWDLLRCTQSLASRVTKWSRDCDVGLHRLICYINSSLDVTMQGFIGDRITECKLWLFCDADWAGERDSKSTSGCALFLVGPNTYYPLNAFSKKQTSITTSSTESEVVAANHGIRAQGLPSLSLWCYLWKEVQANTAGRKTRPPAELPKGTDTIVARTDPELDEIRYGESSHEGRSVADINGLDVHLSDKFKVQVLEDNQATITIILKGDSEKLRHTDRTQKLSFAWMQQQFEKGQFGMINVDTLEQVADIFTKPFSERGKWEHALMLINHVREDEKPAEKPGRDSQAQLKKSQAAAAIQEIEMIASELSRLKSYECSSLERLCEEMSTNRAAKKSKRLRIDSKHNGFYQVYGAWTHGGMQGVTRSVHLFPMVTRYLNEFVRARCNDPAFTWTSVVISKDSMAKVHSDSHNLKGSTNVLLSFGDHQGGKLWTEDPDVPNSEAVFQNDGRGVSLKGKVFNTYDTPVHFDPSVKHCVLPYRGTRISITAYTSRGFPKMTNEEIEQLKKFGFRCGKPTAAAAPHARQASRPQLHKRVLVDFATESDSLLQNHTEQCISLCVAQQSLDNTNLNKLANNLRSLCDEGGSSNKTKPLLFFVSFASSLSEQDRDKTLKALMSLYRMTKQLCPQLVIETNNRVSWDSCKVAEVVRTFGLQRHDPYASSVFLKRLLEVRPDHGRLRLSEAKVNALHLDWIATISRTQLDVEDISSDVQDTKTETSLACVALPSFHKAGGNSRPIEAMDYSQQVRDFWQRQLWAGVIASESLSLQEDVEDAEIKALYQYMPVQAAAANMFDPESFPYLREVCSLDDTGMSLLMPDGSRGRKRILILVSDSTTVFVAGKKTKTNILSDLAAAKNTSLSMYMEIIYEPLWGKTLTEISARIVALIDQTIMRYGVSDPELLIDAVACWQGNELVGRRRIFLNPQPPSWWDHQQGPITAEGSWEKICTRCFQNLNALAETQRRLPQVGVVQLLSGIRGFVYGLPKQFDECMRTIFDEAARNGLAVASMHEYCSDLPLFTDGYHFREDSQSRRKLIAGISHGIHLATAELYAKNAVLADRPGFLNLQKKHRFDPRGRYLVDSRALTESLRKLARAKPTNAEVHTSNDQDAVDPWEDEWFETKREEVHAGMPALSTEELTAAIEKHNVMRVDQYRWARADEVGDSGELANAPLNEEADVAPESPHRPGADITAAGPKDHIWGDSILKTSGSEERAAKRARKDERLAEVARNEVIAAQGAANMRRWQDCLDFAEMTGVVLHDYWNSSPSKDEADAYLVVNQSDMTPGLAKPRIDPGVRNFITGLIRGNFIDKGEKFRLHSWEGPWVLALEVLQVTNRIKRVNLGLGTLLEMACHDNKGRLSFKGPMDHTADTIGQPAFPVYIRCVHGHHENLARTFAAEEIAVGWLSPYTSEGLDRFDNALREERPIIPIEKAPPRLYHRTTHDAAFSILADSLQPGFGGSGKAHCYFSGQPLEEAKTKAGVRANLPVEIVFDTAEVLAAGCEVFVTESEGFLTGDNVPGHCILFINDDVKDVNLWSRTGGIYAADEAQEAAGSESPTKVEADQPANQEPASGSQATPTTGPEFLKPPAYEATETSSVAEHEEVPPVMMETEQEVPIAETDATMPSVEERPPVPEGTPIVPTELTTTVSHISSTSIINIVQDVQGKAVHAYQQEVHRNEPIHYGGTEAKPTAAFLESINCCHCGTRCLDGQRICFGCGGPVKPGQLRRQNSRTQLARGREAMINQLADDNNAPRVFLSKLKSASKDVAGRGMASFEGDSIRKAKLALGKAKKLGFQTILERFTKDNTYACSLTNNGITRRSVRVMDCLVQAYLPNPGRTTTQRAMAVGSNATVTQEIGPHREDVPHCRVAFFECSQEDLCVAGLTSTPDDAPVAFTWYGAFLSMQDFVKNCARCESSVQLQTFGYGMVEIRGNDVTLISQNLNTMIADDVQYASQAAAEARASAQRSQAAQPKYQTHLPPGKGEAKGKGKGKGKPREPSTPPPQRPPRGEAEWSWYNRGWSDREWDQWYSQWHGWQQRGWNWR